MKIVSWNCNGVFREDFKVVQKEIDPDIYVIQECENPKKEGNEFVDYNKFAGEEKVRARPFGKEHRHGECLDEIRSGGGSLL